MLYLLQQVVNDGDIRFSFYQSKAKAIKAYTKARKNVDEPSSTLDLFDDAESLEISLDIDGVYVIVDIATRFQTTKDPIRSWSEDDNYDSY